MMWTHCVLKVVRWRGILTATGVDDVRAAMEIEIGRTGSGIGSAVPVAMYRVAVVHSNELSHETKRHCKNEKADARSCVPTVQYCTDSNR
jgi:hypothetical protein